MISAESFAKQGAVWHRATPVLENYMRWFNDNLWSVGEHVFSRAGGELNSLIAEIAFRLLSEDFATAEASGRAYIARLPRGELVADRELSPQNLHEIAQIRDNIEAYLNRGTLTDSTRMIEHRPRFAGCGVVEMCEGDILQGRELVEIKAVRRPFRSSDLRQPLTYAALAYAAGRPIDVITLLNPRQGSFRAVQVKDLAPDVGAGSWPELMKDLIDAMSGLEVSL